MYIEKRRRKYFALHTIPEDVREALGGRVRFTAALGTDSLKIAETRARILDVRWRRLIDEARSKSTDHIERDAMFWRQLAEDAPEHEKRLVHDAVADEAQARVERAASKAGILDHRLHEYGELAAHDEAARFHAIATGKLVRLDERLEEWLATLAGSNEPKSIDMKRSSIKRFAAAFQYVSDVERRAVQKWVNDRGHEGKKAATIGRFLTELRGYWRYLKSLQVVDEDEAPFDGLSLPKNGKGSKADERRPFSASDVVKLLNAAHERDDKELADLIELGMWTGARIEELCALKIEKVKDGMLEIEDAKTSAGWRQVPVHSKLKPTLKRLLRDSTDGYVLSGLTANKYGKRKGAVGKRFGHLKTALGFGDGFVFHSIRKTVATMFENAGVPEGVAADILGHEKTTMTYGLYSGGASLETKRKAVEKLAYPLRGASS